MRTAMMERLRCRSSVDVTNKRPGYSHEIEVMMRMLVSMMI